MNNIYKRGSSLRNMLKKNQNQNDDNLLKKENFPEINKNSNINITKNTKWGKKSAVEIIKNDNPKILTKKERLQLKNLPWKYKDDIKYNGPIPQNYVVIREVCHDDPDILQYSKYTNRPYSDEMYEYLSEINVEKYGVDGWYRECTDYDLYPTRDSWISMWDPDLQLLESGYPLYDSEESDLSDSDIMDSPIKRNSKFVCPTCNYEFPSKQRLLKHMRQSDHGEYFDNQESDYENY